MKQFLTVLQFELNNYFKNKSFVITTILLMVVIAGILVVPTLIPGFLQDDEKQEELLTGEETFAYVLDEGVNEELSLFLKNLPVPFTEMKDQASLEKEVKKETVTAGFILHDETHFSYVVKNRGLSDQYSMLFANILKDRQKQTFLANKGISMQDYAAMESIAIDYDEIILGKDSINTFAYSYVLVFMIYFLILFYGQMIAVSVTNEKSNRAIEILVTSVNPNSLIFGKVVAGAIAGIVQTTCILGTGFLCFALVKDQWNHELDMLFDVPFDVWVVYLSFGLLSYLLYSFIYGGLGALVSKTEDISKSATPITLVYIASFLIAMFGMSNSEGLLMKVASYIPFTSGNAMFIRFSMGDVALWELGLSFVILVISCLFTGVVAAKIFRFGTLHYGNPIKLSTALKKLKH